jgi:NAD(P)-dependent dehydrogenase (short-subunit alcohol dehydrogenase family)
MGILEKMRLDGKNAFITGGARGIGKSIATAVAEAGANVAIIDIDIAEAEKTAAEIAGEIGVKTMAIKCDITVQEDVDSMVDIVQKTLGAVNIAFCNAGICTEIPAEKMIFDEWYKVININLNGTFRTAQAAGKAMIDHGGGSIICTASMSAHIVNVPQPQCAYNASKAAIIQLAKSMAIEWAEKKVRVNTISPGYIGTELTLNSPDLVPLIGQWNAMHLYTGWAIPANFSPLRFIWPGTPALLQPVPILL